MQPKRKNLRCVSFLLFVFMAWFMLLSAGPALAQVHDYDISSCSQGVEGSYWQPTGPPLATDWYVRQIATSPNFAEDQTLFAATGSNNLNDTSLEGVFASYDGGTNWRHVLNQRVTAIGVSPDFAQDGIVITANCSGRVFVSHDRGQTWEGTTDIPSNTAWALAFSPSFARDKTIFLAGARGLLVSADGGYHWQTWAGAPQNIACLALSSSFATDHTLFVGVTGSYEKNGLYRSLDGGKTWEQAGLKGIAVRDIAFSPNYLQDRTIYAVGGDLFKSTDGGETWEKIGITGANGCCLAVSPRFAADKTIFVGTEGLGTEYYDGVVRCKDGLQDRLLNGLLGKTERDLVAVDTGGGVRLFAAVTMKDRLWGEVYTLFLPGEVGATAISKEGTVQRGIEYPFWLGVTTEDARYALLEDSAYPEEYAKLPRLLGRRVQVTGYLDTGPGFPDPVQGHIRVIKVEPLEEPVTGKAIIDDPSFVTLTAVQNSAAGTDTFNLEVKANNPALPVEVSYLVLDANGTPANPSSGVAVHPDGECETGWLSGQQFYHTEVGGWADPRFTANPQSFPLPHYRTCILMLAHYEKVYLVFLRENDGQLTYKVLQGGAFTGLDVPGLGEIKRQGKRFEVRSYGDPVEVGLWAKGQYLHDEVAGWAQPEYKENPKYYDIPHYGMFMLMIARYDKIGLIIGNENDGQFGAVVLTGSHLWDTEAVAELCQINALIPRSAAGVRYPGAPAKAEVRATGSDPVEVSHFAFDNTCWQWEVGGWAKPGFAPNPQTFELKHYIPGFLMVSRYGKVGIFFYKENDGQLGVLPVAATTPPVLPPVTAPGQQPAAVFRIGQNSYEAGGQNFPMDAAPYIKDGRTYVPIRFLANALGVRDQDITWDQATRTATLSRGNLSLKLQVGSCFLARKVAGQSPVLLVMDVAPEVRSGRLFLPGRFVAAGLGYAAAWEAASQQVTLTPCETAWAEGLILDPNPVEPDRALSITVRTSGPAAQVTLSLNSSSTMPGPLPGGEFWQTSGEKVTLSPVGSDVWIRGVVAPSEVGVYPVEVTVDGLIFTADDWFLKVYPEGFLQQTGYATPEEALRARFAQDFRGCELRRIDSKTLLPDDRRDPRYHKLFLITFYQPYDGPVLPAGTHSYFYYVLRDGPNGLWRVAEGGTGP